jgi:hypothetical protein
MKTKKSIQEHAQHQQINLNVHYCLKTAGKRTSSRTEGTQKNYLEQTSGQFICDSAYQVQSQSAEI